jgi:hypothetical protein
VPLLFPTPPITRATTSFLPRSKFAIFPSIHLTYPSINLTSGPSPSIDSSTDKHRPVSKL